MSEFISFSYLDEDNEEVYALLGTDLIENLGLTVEGVDLSHEEHKRLQSQVRQAIAQAIAEYDPHAAKTADQRVQGGPQSNISVSVRGLGLTDEVTAHVKMRLQQDLSERIADKIISLRAHPRDPGPPVITTCARPLPPVPILALGAADFQARFRDIPLGETRKIDISGGPSTGLYNLEKILVYISPFHWGGPPLEYIKATTQIFLRNYLWSELKRNPEDEFYNRGVRIWRCAGDDPRRPDPLEPLTVPFLRTVAPGEGAVGVVRTPPFDPSVSGPRTQAAYYLYKAGTQRDYPAGTTAYYEVPADTLAISGNFDDRVLACWDPFQFWPLYGGRQAVFEFRKYYGTY